MRDELRKVEYKIEKSNERGKWLIMRYSETKRGCSIGKVFEGNKKECLEKVKEYK